MKQVTFSLLLSILISFLVFNCALGQEADLFSAGNAAYKQEDYKKAISSFNELLATGKLSKDLYYNLGNAYLKDKQVGPAIINYERGLRLKPSDSNIIQNLAVAKEEIATPVTEIPEFFMVRFWKAFASLFSPLFWMVIQMVLAFLFLYGIYLWRLSEKGQQLRGFSMMVAAFLLLLTTYLAGRTASWVKNRKDVGIVMELETLRSGPDNRADEIESLSSGVKVKILDTIDDWYKVSLVNKEQGWIKNTAVEII